MDYKDPTGYQFEDTFLQIEYLNYLRTRNVQIAEFKQQGKTWQQIADLMELSREHVKNIGHKQGVIGKQHLKVPDRKCPMCGQTIISKTVGKARGQNLLNGSATR